MATDKILVELAVENTKAIKAINQTLKSIQGFSGKATKKLSFFEKQVKATNQAFVSFAGNLGAIAVTNAIGAITNGLRESIEVAIRFDKALIGVAKTTDLSGRPLKAFGEDMQKLARTVPLAADSLLDLAKVGGQLGISGAKNLSKFVETMAQLQASTDIAGEAGAQSILKILNLTGQGVEQIEGFGASIAFLGNNFKTTEAQIVGTATNVAGALAQFDVSSADVLGLSTTMVELGIRAELSGSTMGRAFRGIKNAINEGGVAMQTLSKLSGIASADLKQAFEKDAVGVFRKFIEGLSGVKDIDGTLAQFKLRGEEILKVLPSMAKQSERLGLALDSSNTAFTEQTALVDEATRAFGSLESRNKIANNRFEELSKTLGDSLAPLLITSKELMLDFSDALGDLFLGTNEENVAELDERIKKLNKSIFETAFARDHLDESDGDSFFGIFGSDADNLQEKLERLQKELATLQQARIKIAPPKKDEFVGPPEPPKKDGEDGTAGDEEKAKTQEILNAIIERQIAIAELDANFANEQAAFAQEQLIADQELEAEIRLNALVDLQSLEDEKLQIKADALLAKAALIKDADLRELTEDKIKKETLFKQEVLDNKRRLKGQKAYDTEKKKLDKQTQQGELSLAKAGADALLALTGDNQFAALAISKGFAIADIFVKDGAARAAATLAALNAASTAGPAAPAVFAANLAGLNAIIAKNTALSLGVVAAQTVAGVARFQTGGIVGGPQTGDQNVIRVDGGEGILTREGVRAIGELNSGNTPPAGGDVVVNISGDFIGEESMIDTLIDRINDATEFRNRELQTGT